LSPWRKPSPLALALGFAGLHALIALATASLPWLYGPVGEHAMADDVRIYFGYASRAVGGEIPYRDFRVEYPPLALPIFLAPRLVTADFTRYRGLFAAEVLAANAAALVLVARVVARQGTAAEVARRLAWYTLAFAAACPMAVCRFDLPVSAWAFAAAVAWSSGRAGLGGVLAGSGTLLKVVPGVTLAPGLAAPGGRRGLAGFAAGLFVVGLPWAWLAGRAAAASLTYHIGRGVEIGSLPAGVMMAVAGLTAAPLSWAGVESVIELQSPWSGVIGQLALPLQIAAVLVVGWRARRSGVWSDPLRFHAAAVLAVAAFGKVLSPQYVIWLIPFLASLGGRLGVQSRGVFLVACVLTTAIYPWSFLDLLDFSPRAVVLLNARNALLVGLWSLLMFAPPAGMRFAARSGVA
jgi:hypothetical protein